MAIYTIDEGSTELVIQLPHNFPLGPVSVDSGKRVGVTAAQWRTWILQLTTFLQASNICTGCGTQIETPILVEGVQFGVSHPS